MTTPLPMADENFEEVEHQGKHIKVGDQVIIQQAGQERVVEVSAITLRQGHYWVGYEANSKFCPWPLVRQLQNLDEGRVKS